MNEVANIKPSRLPISKALANEYELSANQWRVLVEQVFPSAKSVESIFMALEYCKSRNLDILKRPVHIVPVWSSEKGCMIETVWPGIAEVRTTASRTGQYAGCDKPILGEMQTKSFSGTTNNGAVNATVKFPISAEMTVYRIVQGVRCAFTAEIWWEESYASIGKTDVPNAMWAKRPIGQFLKCLEAATLRIAFPEELGSIYAAEEMEGRTIDAVAMPTGNSNEQPMGGAKTPPPPPPPQLTEEKPVVSAPVAPPVKSKSQPMGGNPTPKPNTPRDDTPYGQMTSAPKQQEQKPAPEKENSVAPPPPPEVNSDDEDEIPFLSTEMLEGASVNYDAELAELGENLAACTTSAEVDEIYDASKGVFTAAPDDYQSEADKLYNEHHSRTHGKG